MRIHVLGICGTFMAGIALLAKQSGHEVSGSDMNVYPPMSTQLAAQGIKLMNGYDPDHLDPAIDCVIVGNVISRGNPVMEYILDHNIPYSSGPQWLAENILRDRWVLAVSGTHGKTTTTSLLTWILEHAGLNPGFLIGGVPENFGISARLGDSPFFVIEADEYDSAFFDKRPKFIHYHPKTAIMNNLEFDHADIYADLDAIKQQFHYLVRTIPGNGLIVRMAEDANLESVLEKGCWTPITSFGGEGAWQAKLNQADGGSFDVYYNQTKQGTAEWSLLGKHNVNNALAAIAAAHHAGVSVSHAIEALALFKNVKRRLEIKGKANGITLYDDFAHHPTAIATTLEGLRAKVGKEARILVVLEFGSYTMRSGVHKDQIKDALVQADVVVCKRPEGNDWGLEQVLKQLPQPYSLHDNVDSLVNALAKQIRSGDHVVVMSNSGFGGIHEKLLQAIQVVA
jgi:UDP-N-acetylmuramate: L-alanyl-gamma-D-glutamyl-meso-diaminopimelate ligase